MSFTLDTTEDIGGSAGEKYLTEPGTYHCVVVSVDEGKGPKGNPINGFTAELAVLDGTVAGQKDRETSVTFFSPDASKSEASQEWNRKKQTAFAIATGLLDLAKLGSKVEIDLQEAVGRQLVIQLAHADDDKKFLQINYANIYHVDDPRAEKFPKSKEGLAIVPKELRKPAEYFAPLQKKSGGANGKSESRLSQDDLSDL